MGKPSAPALAWLDERLGITSLILPALSHRVPRRIGWWYVLGSATLGAFFLQVVTGVALAMVYVPAPDSAFQSVQFITGEAVLGRLVRGAHYFGAAAMLTLVFAHLVRVFLFAAYKYPRELTWVSGSLLLLLALALAFTGQLLRWDQDSFWAVVVAVEQVGKTPVIGDILMRLVAAGWTVGPATLSRFYATHVFLLPALTFLLLAVHLYLVVRLGISEPPEAGRPVDPSTYSVRYQGLLRQGKPFFPDVFWQDAAVAVAVTVAVLVLATLIGPPELGQIADPSSVATYPKPDWYFLWYYALVASVRGLGEVVVIIGLPLLVGVALLVLPFAASRGERSPRRRPWALGLVVLMFGAFLALTYQGMRSPWAPIVKDYRDIPFPKEVLRGLSPAERRGADVFNLKACHACHSIGGIGGKVGPDLTNAGSRLTRDLMVLTIVGRSNMPSYLRAIEPGDLDDLVAFLRTLKGAR